MRGDRPSDTLWTPLFRRYFALRVVAMVGNALSLVAFPVLAYRLTGRASVTALITAAESLPYLAVGLIAGAMADRWNRRRILVLTGALGAVLMASIPLAAALASVNIVHVLLVAVAVATLWVFADAATFGVLPQLAGRSKLPEATSALATVGTGIGVVGPVVAGVLVTTASPVVALAIDAVAFAFLTAGMMALRWPGSEDRPGRGADRDLRREIGEGVRFLWAQPVVRWLTVLGVGSSLAGGAVSGLLVVLGVEQLGLARDDARLGWLYAAAAVGSFVGSLALPRVQRRLGVGLITTVGYAGMLAPMLVLASLGSWVPALVVLAVFHLAFTVVIVNGIVTRQVITPDHLQGRVNTTARLIAWGGAPLGAALAGVLADVAGTAWALRLTALGLVVSLTAASVVGVPRYPRVAVLRERSALPG
ncbi:MFS transporter [Nocardioides sp. R-C-SC26]|uniref:MFS transporter n=1 Tax=Nocardioides sp. R-C-SC26 TaxID=2870414 RepID=UPI001E3BEADC|nr:MFS transporter [Nocardioides sp. R-C-SC26]